MRRKVLKNIPPIKAKPAYKKELEEIFCDIDGKSIGYAGVARYRRCYICKRELCLSHAVADDYHSDDYPDFFCAECIEKYEPARKEMNARHDKEEAALIARIKRETLKQPKQKMCGCCYYEGGGKEGLIDTDEEGWDIGRGCSA